MLKGGEREPFTATVDYQLFPINSLVLQNAEEPVS
jgi:hypothetical protein